jgi:hypothetical protein
MNKEPKLYYIMDKDTKEYLLENGVSSLSTAVGWLITFQRQGYNAVIVDNTGKRYNV